MPLELGNPVHKRSPCLSAFQEPWKAQGANTCSSGCSGGAALLCCRLHLQPRNPVGKRLRSLALLACGRALCSAASFCGGVSGGILRFARMVGQSRISVAVPLSLGEERDESSGCLWLLLTASKTVVSRKLRRDLM